jgi:hypothetical protein
MCSFVNFKFTNLKTSQFKKVKILKLQILVCKHVKLRNYKVTKLQIANALLHIYKFAHARFSCFHTCMYYKITKLQFRLLTHDQVCKFINCMCMFIFKFIKLKASQFKIMIKTKIANTCLQICNITKITNCKCIFAYLQVCTC